MFVLPFLLHFPPTGAASPFALRRSGSARRASQAKKYATGIFFLTPSSGSAPQRGKRFWMLAFLLLHFPPTGAASPFALWRSGSARRASQAKKYATGIFFLTPSSGSASQRGEHGLMLAFLLMHFPPAGAASPFALMALRLSSQGLSG